MDLKQMFIIFVIGFVLLVLIRYLSNSRFKYEHFVSEAEMIAEARKFWNIKSAGPSIVVFETNDFKGATKAFYGSQSTQSLKEAGWNDKISSFILSPFTKVSFFENDFYGNTASVSNDSEKEIYLVVSGDLKEKISSFKIEFIEPYVIFYELENHGGKSKVIKGNIANVPAAVGFVPKSMLVSPYTDVVLFKGKSFTGNESKPYENRTSHIMRVSYLGSGWAQEIQSIKMQEMFDKNSTEKKQLNQAQSKNMMFLNENLLGGNQLTSQNDLHKLVMQSDGNLVLYSPRGVAWATNTNGGGFNSPFRACLHPDGNLVVYGTFNGKEVSRWETRTTGRGVRSLMLKDDGNLVLLGEDNAVVWQTNTATRV